MSFRLRRRFGQLMLIGTILTALGNWMSKTFAQTLHNLLHQLAPSQEQTWLM
jgi:hypothetical protein